MSRTVAALAAAFAFTALVAGGAPAQAQSSDPISGASPGMSRPMAPAQMGRPMSPARMERREMRRDRRAMRRTMRADRRAAQNPDAAYMGGGAVYERAADGSLRPVM